LAKRRRSPASELAELTDDAGIEVFETGAGVEQLFDQAQSYDVALDHSGIGRFGEVLEPEQAGACIALRHFDQQFDISPKFLRQTPRDGGKEVGRRVAHDRGDNAFQRTGSRQHDLPAAQSVLCTGQQFRDAAAFQSTFAQPFAKVGFRRLIEPAQAQIAANALCLNPFRRLTAGAVEEQHWWQAKLAGEVIDDLDRRVPVIFEQATVDAEYAELQREAAAMVSAAAGGDHGEVGRRQAPVPRQFVLAWIGRQRHPSTGLRGCGWGFIHRH
jgi:hypothetical protein